MPPFPPIGSPLVLWVGEPAQYVPPVLAEGETLPVNPPPVTEPEMFLRPVPFTLGAIVEQEWCPINDGVPATEPSRRTIMVGTVLDSGIVRRGEHPFALEPTDGHVTELQA